MAEPEKKPEEVETKTPSAEDTKPAEVDEVEDKKSAQEEKVIPAGQMQIKVYSPFKVYFDAPANSITALNDSGPFDILTGHKKFLTLINPCEMEVITNEGTEKIKIQKGIMFVKEDRVTVFLDV